MSNTERIDLPQAHQFFAAYCFNETWALLDQPRRMPQDDEQMLLRAYASLWHWTQREDCTEQTLSVGYWLISRVHAVLGQVEGCACYAEKCLGVSAALAPFYLGYAHEALARAAMLRGDPVLLAHHLAAARQLVLRLEDPDERAMLEADLQGIG